MTAANRLGLDYRAETKRFLTPEDLGCPTFIDVHTHINGDEAARIYGEAREAYGVGLTYSMTQFAQAETVRARLGDSIRFIAIPDYSSADRAQAFQQGFVDRITEWAQLGARICKFWVAPRGRDFGKEFGDPSIFTLESPWRAKQMDHAASLGMMLMCHIADPDTWFRTKYTDVSFYGSKADQYEPLERLLDEYSTIPWMLAHMGGWPEDLEFLDGLLERHPHVHLDTSATKWMVRELSKHPTARMHEFMRRWSGRILFGTDIVSAESHVGERSDGREPPNNEVSTPKGAYDLYASRYWALRTLFEREYQGESPIADPDLMLEDPGRFDELSAPELVGHALPHDVLRSIYFEAPSNVLNAWHERGEFTPQAPIGR